MSTFSSFSQFSSTPSGVSRARLPTHDQAFLHMVIWFGGLLVRSWSTSELLRFSGFRNYKLFR